MRLQLSAVLSLLAGCAAGRLPPSHVGVGDRLEFVLPDLSGASRSNADLIGKVVLVDLWATWCVPCKESLPFYSALFQQYSKEGLVVVAISVDEHKDDVERFVRTRALPFMILLDPDGSIPKKIGLQTLPTLMIVGRDGAVAYLHPGFLPSEKESIAREVEKALALATSTSTGAAP